MVRGRRGEARGASRLCGGTCGSDRPPPPSSSPQGAIRDAVLDLLAQKGYDQLFTRDDVETCAEQTQVWTYTCNGKQRFEYYSPVVGRKLKTLPEQAKRLVDHLIERLDSMTVSSGLGRV